MKHDKYTFDDVFHQVNKYVRNNMSKHEETLFIQEVKSNKRLGKLVAVICSFIKHSKQYFNIQLRMKRLCLTTVLILAMSNMLFAKYHIRHQRPHYHTETRPSDDNQDDNHIALLILIGGLSIGGYLLYRKRKINKYQRG